MTTAYLSCAWSALNNRTSGCPAARRSLQRSTTLCSSETPELHPRITPVSARALNGSKRFPKERVEVFAGGRVLQLDNFRKLTGFGWSGFTSMNLWRQDKGQSACAAAFVDAVRRGLPSPIPFEEIVEVSRVSIEVAAGV